MRFGWLPEAAAPLREAAAAFAGGAAGAGETSGDTTKRAPASAEPAAPPNPRLTRTRFQRQAPLVMGGTARVLPESCLAHLGDPCRTCVDTCPVAEALSLVDAKPSVNAALCTGCGDCERSCPAPAPGILAMPNIPNLHGHL